MKAQALVELDILRSDLRSYRSASGLPADPICW